MIAYVRILIECVGDNEQKKIVSDVNCVPDTKRSDIVLCFRP